MLYLKMRRSFGARLGRIGFIAFLALTAFALTVPGVALAGDYNRYGHDDGKYSYGYDHHCAHTHYIKAGETLSQIASRYHVPADKLAHANGVKNADLIVEGQKLCIPHHSGYGDHKSGSVRWSDGHDHYGHDGYGKDSYGHDGYGKDGYDYGHDYGYDYGHYGKDSYGYDHGYDYGYDDHYGKRDGHDDARKYGSVRWSDGRHDHDSKYDYDYGYKGHGDSKYKDGYGYGRGWD